MKHKFSSMGRVAIALVLALSLSLVMAAPVVAAGLTSVSATPADATEDQETTYTICFTTATTYSVATVEIEFETTFDPTSAALVGTATGIGAEDGDVGVVEQVVTYTVAAPAVIDAGTAITIVLSGIVNPTAAGDYAVTVTTKDGTTATIDTGTVDVTITPLPVSFEVVAGTSNTVTAGEAFSVTITAKDAEDGAGEIETGYTGDHLIDFTDNGAPTGTLPIFELISFTDGVGTSLQNFILTNAGETDNQIIATDNELSPAVAGTSDAITINLPALDHFDITGAQPSVTAGAAFEGGDITVTAFDSLDNEKTDYIGTVSWTSSDPLAELPDAHALVAGTFTFTDGDFTLKTAGSQTITATGDGVSQSATITVDPEEAIEIGVIASPTSIAADGRQSSTITATAYDEFGNVDTSYAEAGDFTASLGDLSAATPTFASGVATSILTSDEVGTATIVVDQSLGTPSLAYVTTTVTLTESLGPDEVWVSSTTGDDSQTLGAEASPFLTIQKGINEVAIDGTVNVMPGTYDLSTISLEVSKTGITVQSTHGAAVTIIDADAVTGGPAISIHASDVTFEGFTVVMGGATDIDGIWIWYGTEGVTVQNNTITDAGLSGVALTYAGGTVVVDSATVSGNLIEDCVTGIDVGGCLKDSTISNNTITGCESGGRGINFAGGTAADPTQGNTITGNTITANACMGIYVKNNSTHANDTLISDNNLIEGNTISANDLGGIVIGLLGVDLTITNLSINNNNITGNTAYGIENLTGIEADAENNWWGTAVESAIADMVFGYVDYSPWLNAAYPYGESTTTGDPAIVLETGWNLISLPLIPTNSAIETVLADLITLETVEQVRTYDQGIWPSWARTGEPPVNLLTDMEDGQGFWVQMSAAGNLVVSGYELCAPAPAVPPQYDVVAGWNLIGYKFIIPGAIATYLGDVSEDLQAIYGYDASTGFYFIPVDEANGGLIPGYGYWIALTEAGTIYPAWATPGTS